MQTGRMYLRRAFFLVLTSAFLLAASAQICSAQDDDEDDDASSQKPTAWLSLTFDNRGQAQVHLSLDRTPGDWQPIQAALGQTLHCPSGEFAHPPVDQRAFPGWSRMKPEQLAKYQKSLTDASQRQLQGSCGEVLAASGWTVGGTLTLQPLAEALAQSGEQQLSVSVQRPKTACDEHSSAGLQTAGDGGGIENRFLSYSFALGAATPAPALHLAYGYRNSDMLRQCAMSAGFLLLPLLLILWMRRAALNDALQDPTAAWFSYFKTLQWCVNGTMLLWMVARTSFRQGVQDLVAFRLPAVGWQPAVAHTLVVIVPPWIVYLLCLFLSYKVFVQFRGSQWTRREFMLERSLDVGAIFLPLMFFCCALDFLTTNTKLLIVLMLAAFVSRVLCLRAKIRVSRVAPEALTTGELRDRIFELAKRAGVKIKQVFVLSAGRMQIANAYATGTQTVMFTDYLLERLTKREVDAIAGHELSHLRHGHPKKLGLTLIGAILFPSIFRGMWTMLVGWFAGVLETVSSGNRDDAMEWYRWSSKLGAWSQLDLALIVAGFGVFYLLARRFERTADEGSVQLVGDAEAMMTALLKVSRLNLTPIQWGKVTGSILTHPTTLKRIEHLARVGNVPAERVQQVLALHAQEEQARRAGLPAAQASDATFGSPFSSTANDEHYAVPSSAKSVVSTIAALRRASNNQWLLIAANVLPPALVAWTVHKLNLHGQASLVAYLAGAVLILAGYSLLGLRLGLRGRAETRRQFIRKFDAEGIQIRGRNAILAGFSPGASLRIYLSGYDWDKGFVWLLQGRFVYLGDKIRFALKPEQVVNIRIGESAPGWWTSERVYLDWRDAEHGREGTLSFYPSEPSSAGKIKSEGKALCAAVQRWQSRAVEYPSVPTTVQALESPVLGEVTSHDPKDRLSRGKRLNTLILLWLLSYGASLLLGVPGWYGFLVVLMLRIYERIPYWRYRAPAAALPMQQSQAARAQAAGAR
jgi:Zn-dependent protease with chaperone function